MMAPQRTREQRLDALARANEIRSRRADLKAQLKTGDVDLGDVLVDVPDWAATMRVRAALLATPGLGQVKADRLLAAARVSPSKTLGGISARQRLELAAMLPARRRQGER